MINALRLFFDHNSILVLFVYGQTFFTLGLAVALQSRRHSRLELARPLGWLAAFGFVHGLNEWGDIFIPFQMGYLSAPVIAFMQVIQVLLLALSFGFLFQFGVELLRPRWPHLANLPLILMVIWGLWFVMPGFALTAGVETWQIQASIWARYLLGFPGGLISAIGLRYQAEKQIKPLHLTHIYRTLLIAGLALGAYAFLGGLVVPASSFFPANWLNADLFLYYLGTPVPVFRSLTGIFLTVAIIRVLEVFDVEVDQLIEHLEIELSLMAERERIGRELHDGTIQQIYAAGLILETVRRKVTDESLGQKLDRALLVLNEAITSLRAYLKQLHLAPTGGSLSDGLRQWATDARFTALMMIDLNLDLPKTDAVPPHLTNHILSILNEALANAARHANARQVQIQAQIVDGRFSLYIHDDGHGFLPQSKNEGYGSRNMRDRARLLGGELSLTSQPGAGTTIHLSLPWDEKWTNS